MREVKTGMANGPGELKGALLGFVDELKNFRQDIQKKLDAQDDRMSMFERKNAFRNRSPLSTEAVPELPHQKAFNAYLRHGDDAGLRGLAVEEKGLTAASDGGFLAAPQVAQNVQNSLSGAVSLRALANVVTVDAASYDVLIDRDNMVTGWANETSMAETAAAGVERISIPLHELSAMPKASQRLLDDAAFDVETWLAERIADKFSRAEAHAFLRGDGLDKPVGILNVGFDTTGAGSISTIGELKTGTAGAFSAATAAEVLIDLVYALPAQHRANAAFLMTSKTAAVVRKLKDADGRFIWADSLAAGEPARLLGYPVMLAEDMPELSNNSRSILFGNFKAAYTIVERPELRVLRDPFSAKPHVLFYATKRVGGGLVDGRAVKVLRFGA
ncbi:MAG: phage major capsid protein [Paracoccus sp. (in: a-proteobacteria)]